MLALFLELRFVGTTERAACSLLAPMRRMNRSTCPAVSTMRCSPVKNGWQLLHRSVFNTGWVDIVSQVLPQAQITVAFT